jgi:NAD(P)-dependent dehydrogenase (short-subunit alcohol dehydrogenase family)
VGPGPGWALAQRFVTENMQVGAVARDEAKLNSMIESGGCDGVRPYAADVSNSEGPDPESRGSGFEASPRPGMTV